MRILLVGGGTAGHAWPIILLARSLLKNRRVKLLYVGSRQGIECHLVKNLSADRQDFSIPFKAILVGKRRSYFSFANYWDLIKTFIGIIQSLFIIFTFRPNVIFAKGGYVTVPIISWLGFFKIPLVIHESDVVMGKANKMAIRFANKICLGFPIEEYKENLPLEKLVYTGIPVQNDFLQTPIKTGDRLNLLITGGSQGSSKINILISEILPKLLEKYVVYHLTGKRDYLNLSKNKDSNYHLYDFTDQMPKLMRDSDLVISRSGASTLAEISATGKASIIIPLESAKGEHQESNARVFQKRNAAVVLSEKNLTASSLLAIIDNLMTDENMRQLIGHHARSLFQPDATRELINSIFEVAHDK